MAVKNEETCLVTGANAGLGRATASRLAETGAQVVMVCRDSARGKTAKDEIVSGTKNDSIELLIADMSSLASIRRLADEFADNHPSLDVLINNAAVFTSQRIVTQEGFEQMFATNYLGPFLLTRLLIPNLERGKASRIINVTAPSTTRPNLGDLQGERKFSPLRAFGASKASQLLFTYALARRLEGRGVTVSAYHPGIMKTDLNRTAPAPARLISGMINLFAGKPPSVAAEGLVNLATSEVPAETSGRLVHDGKIIRAPFIEDKGLQDGLWRISCGLVGVEETV